MLRLFLRKVVRFPHFRNNNKKIKSSSLYSNCMVPTICSPFLFTEYHSLRTGGFNPLLNWRFAYVIISNDVFVYISKPLSKACLWFIFEIQFHHVSPQFTAPNGSTVTCVMRMPLSCRDYTMRVPSTVMNLSSWGRNGSVSVSALF